MTNEAVLHKLARRRTELTRFTTTTAMRQTLDSITTEITLAKVYVDRDDPKTERQLAWIAGALDIFDHWVASVQPNPTQRSEP